MKKTVKFLLPVCLLALHNSAALGAENTPSRAQKADETFKRLFHAQRITDKTDPELMQITQQFIFGEVFDIGNLDDPTRELITIVSLATIQTLPQLKQHIQAALNTGCDPLAIREALYLCTPFIGLPRTLNALAVFNEVATEQGIKLPLAAQGTTTEQNRYQAGKAIQTPLYGDEVQSAMQALPSPYAQKIPYFLTSFAFGDFYTRKGLTIQQKELLVLIILAALGADKQLHAHIVGNLKAGNTKETLLAAMVQTMPYIGMPNALTAINLIKNTDTNTYQPIYN